jgi:H+/Cl- antiporter ClcA
MADQQAAPPPPDWTVEIADRIESVVGTVRDRTTVPITKVARAVVFGVLAAVAGVVAAILLIVAAVRLHVYLPFHPEGRKVWVVYAILSAIFLMAGAFVWRKRAPRQAQEATS